jgi:hypothetical protein
MADRHAITLPACSKTIGEAYSKVEELRKWVAREGVCALPGVSLDYSKFVPLIERAISRGFVDVEAGMYVKRGLWFGFDLGVDIGALPGKRWFNNYPTAWEARDAVTDAQRKRVKAGKTLALCPMRTRDTRALPWESCRVFPMGAVPKPLEPDVMRPVSDHTRSGLKEATDMTRFKHSLRAYEEIAEHLQPGYSMRMSDVDGAFLLLPLAPHLWPYFLHWFHGTEEGKGEEMVLYMHICADFGAAGVPGTFKIFFADVVMGIARSEGVLTLPTAIYVDDVALIGMAISEVDVEGVGLTEFLEDLGVHMKSLKDKPAATLQLALGFWWDSVSRTRTLEVKKLDAYRGMLRAFSERSSLSLREMQQVGGRMQRAVLTLPPGSVCFLATLFAAMRGLKLPHHKRRVSKALQLDFAAIEALLGLNMGKGFFSYEHMERAPAVYTDASKEPKFAGGGYFSEEGAFRYWVYGSAASKQLIDCLEGDAVLVAVTDLAPSWRGKVVPLHIDNRSFQLSGAKGWSKADRLTRQLRVLFEVAVKFECVFEFHWISTHDNVLADALSRQGGLPAFFVKVANLFPGVTPRAHAQNGERRALLTSEGEEMLRLRGMGQGEVEDRPPLSAYASAQLAVREGVTGADLDKVLRALACSLGVEPRRATYKAMEAALSWFEGRHPSYEKAWKAHGAKPSSFYYWMRRIGEVRRDEWQEPTRARSLSPVEGHRGSTVSNTEDGDGPPGCLRLRGSGARDYSKQNSTAGALGPRASIYSGLPTTGMEAVLDEIMDHRLAGSTQSVVKTALTHWEKVCAMYHWNKVIATDDPDRGGKLASFAVYMVRETELAASTIKQYLWGVRTFMKFCRQVDPVEGLFDWPDLTRAISVVAWVPSEPRRMIPLDLVEKALSTVDLNVFWEVQIAVLILVLLFTFARSETPCPKTLDGFDEDQHLQVRDVKLGMRPTLHHEARLKSVKQDRLMERDSVRGNEDWVLIGEAPGVFSLARWMKALFALHGGPREDESPFFVHKDRRSEPLTYGAAMSQYRELVARASNVETAKIYGLHSLRVTGYTLAKRGKGVAVAVAQGGWESSAHERYEGIDSKEVLDLPSAMTKTLLPGAPIPADDVRLEPLPARPPQGGTSAPARELVPSMLAQRTNRGAARGNPKGGVLTWGNCVGQLAFVPASVLPEVAGKDQCRTGWTVRVVKKGETGRKVMVEFVVTTRRREQHPQWVQFEHLQPAPLGAQ